MTGRHNKSVPIRLRSAPPVLDKQAYDLQTAVCAPVARFEGIRFHYPIYKDSQATVFTCSEAM